MLRKASGLAPCKNECSTRDLIEIGEYTRIYDQGVGEAESWYINDHCIVRSHTGQWHMFGITRQEPLSPMEEIVLAHATAAKLTQVPWDKQPFALRADPDNWGEVHLWAPCVVHHDGLYYMYVCVGGSDSRAYKTHLLTSTDLHNWTRHPENPVVVDGFDARDPHVVRLADGRWIMYYTATLRPDGGNHVVAAVVSDDLVHWRDKQVVYMDEEEGTFGGCTESPFVVQRGPFHYLFICNNDRRGGYEATDVYRSENPFEFTSEGRVATLKGHAMEVIRDTDGRWYATHCGWGRGGLYLAPLTWNDGLDD
ncbi:MAG: hypothetical protein PWP23_395 [Candidatus Sumerlaeota bacterium]|nr:hypothetical protein [Candidatus Sumerlaeota bacterium]